MLANQQDWHPKHRGLLHQCKQLLEWGGCEVKISHCYGKVNQVADILAKIGSEEMIGVKLYRSPPVGTRNALLADTVGDFWPRQIQYSIKRCMGFNPSSAPHKKKIYIFLSFFLSIAIRMSMNRYQSLFFSPVNLVLATSTNSYQFLRVLKIKGP